MTTTDDVALYRLSRHVIPSRYDLELSIDFDELRFTGSETVEVEISEACEDVVLNADQLEISDAGIARGWRNAGDVAETQPMTVTLETETERVHFLPTATLEPGRYTLSCRFSGALNDTLAGFYRSRFVDSSGVEHTIATTQFEETDARMAFPCFDEPDLKAIFGVTLVAPPGTVALSNGPEIEIEELSDGSHRVCFGDTIPMSTYLVAFIIGAFEATNTVDVDGVAVRVFHVAGMAPFAQPALEIAAHALRFYHSYFDIPYPGEKLDLVGVPDFAQGAMENLGCVTFREADLLFDPDNVSLPEFTRVAEVIEHELAHMWFGDLVTMAWWNGVWLNEAFATFMSFRCFADYRSEEDPFITAIARYWPLAYSIDGLSSTRPVEFPVYRPDEATSMFDAVTYYKGACTLWMLEQYLGTDRFRAGIRRYLRNHAYANASTSDLWEAIEAESPDVPVRDLMESWIFQGGHPLVTVGAGEDGAILVRQEPFSYLPAEVSGDRPSNIGDEWLVPLLVRPASDKQALLRVLLGADELAVHVDRPAVVKARGAGFYRVRYESPLFDEVLSNLPLLDTRERLNLISDTWAMTKAGDIDLGAFVDAVVHFANETNGFVWTLVVSALRLLSIVAPDDDRPALAAFVRRTLRPEIERIGWQRSPDEDESVSYMRGLVFSALGTIGRDEDVSALARRLFDSDDSEVSAIDAELTPGVLATIASRADHDDFEVILKRMRNPRSPLDEHRYEFSLASLTDVELAGEVHELCLDGIRSQDAPHLLAAMMLGREIGPPTWRFVETHFDELQARFPKASFHRMLAGVMGLATLDANGESRMLPAVRAFADRRVIGALHHQVVQSVEELEVNVNFAKAVRASLGPLLARLAREE